MGMINPVTDGKVSVDFIGKKDLLKTSAYPIAVLCDPDYLVSLPSPYMQDGYAEIIRRASFADRKLIERMEKEDVPIEEMIFSSIQTGEKIKNLGATSSITGFKKKSRYALNFSSIAEKICGLNVSYGKLVTFGMVTAADTAMTLGFANGLDERIIKLAEKYQIKWDIGIGVKKLWETFIQTTKQNYVTLVLPTTLGKCKVVRLSKEKIKETF
jgi:3-dehydroquinate synthetase